ncbi:hypothetical protein [Halorussus aquaticus]|uniref:DUF7847 domain-containing protein n=1 Tax=Halorussus aquaticus TaxID=2953748 RepID=A0ABD5PXL3_9EURY|nr:hypothetical protein [Halorussus aquaticus]
MEQLATRGGALLIVAYAVYQVLTQSVVQSLVIGALGSTGEVSQVYPLAIGLPVAVSTALTVGLVVGGTALGVVAMRALYADIDAFPTPDHTRRLARTVGATIVVSIIVSIAIFVGSLFLLLPGLFLAVNLVFAALVVVIEDAGIVESLKRSWSLSSGHRFRLFLLGVVISVVTGLVGFVAGLFTGFDPLVGALASGAVSGVASVFGVAALVGAYRQIAGDTADSLDATTV